MAAHARILFLTLSMIFPPLLHPFPLSLSDMTAGVDPVVGCYVFIRCGASCCLYEDQHLRFFGTLCYCFYLFSSRCLTATNYWSGLQKMPHCQNTLKKNPSLVRWWIPLSFLCHIYEGFRFFSVNMYFDY